MTRNEILKLEAGPETNNLIAIWVFEWEYDPDWDCLVPPGHPKPPLWVDGEMRNAVAGVLYCGDKPVVKDYTGDIAAAWEAHKIACKWLFSQRREYFSGLQFVVSRRMEVDGLINWPDVFVFVEPVDFCRAALLAVME